jgi:SNF family Na+-dependent transporter
LRHSRGWLFGLLFFIALLGAGYLSGLAAFEVLVAALTDNTRCHAHGRVAHRGRRVR